MIIGVVSSPSTAADAKSTALDSRLATIETKLDAVMAALMSSARSDPTAGVGASGRLLVGWGEISRYCRKGPRTLRRYRGREAFPAWRWGRHVVAAPENIARWLVVREQVRRERRRSTPTESRLP